jgi:hypothetical protein
MSQAQVNYEAQNGKDARNVREARVGSENFESEHERLNSFPIDGYSTGEEYPVSTTTFR